VNSILVIRGGAIGDFVLTMPVLAALREKFPSARISLLTNANVAPLATEFGLVDEVRYLGSATLAPLFAKGGQCGDEVNRWLSGFNVIVSYLYDPEGNFQTNVCRNTQAQYIAGPHRPDESLNQHATNQLLRPLISIGLSEIDTENFSIRDFQNVDCNTMAIHPGSGSRQKNWPIQQWRLLLKHLARTTDQRFVVFGGEAEQEILPQICECIPSERREVVVDLPLDEVARLLGRCSMFVGHDSGISHLAAVMGVECVVLWGPTNEAVWRPLGPKIHIVGGENGLSSLDVSTVLQRLNSLLPTS
jgi:heptosyltransferase-2